MTPHPEKERGHRVGSAMPPGDSPMNGVAPVNDTSNDWRRAAMAGHAPGRDYSARAQHCAVWMKLREVDTVDSRRRIWVSPWQEFMLRAAGEWRPKGMDTLKHAERADAVEGLLPRDHVGAFFREGVPVCITSEPYVSSWRDEHHEKWVQFAERRGLHLTWSLAFSWHYPGSTVLYEAWLSGTFRGGAR